MIDFRKLKSSRLAKAAGAAALIALGAAGGAGAVQAGRPTVEMAPTTPTAIAKLAVTNGIVTVRGRVSDVYGDRFLLQDATGRALIAVGREGSDAVTVGQQVMVQGRFDDGQLRASYLVDQAGRISAIGPRGPRIGEAPAGFRPHDPGRDGPPHPACAPDPSDRGAFKPTDAAPPPPPLPPSDAVAAAGR